MTDRIFFNVNETFSLLDNLFESLARSDQDAWLRRQGLERPLPDVGGSGAAASTSATSSAAAADRRPPSRGSENVRALVNMRKIGQSPLSATSPSGNNRSNTFEVGPPRVRHALSLCGEDHSPLDVTAAPRVFDINIQGAAGKRGAMNGWFEELVAKSAKSPSSQTNNSNDNNDSNNSLVSIDVARQEFLEQENFGAGDPGAVFDALIASKMSHVVGRGGLNFDEFFIVFSRFEYA